MQMKIDCGFRAENRLVFRVVRVRVRALYKRAFRGKQPIVGFMNFKFYFN